MLCMDNNNKDMKTAVMATRALAAIGILVTVLSAGLCLFAIITGKFYAKTEGFTKNLKVEDPTAFWLFLSLFIVVTAGLLWSTVNLCLSAMKTYKD